MKILVEICKRCKRKAKRTDSQSEWVRALPRGRNRSLQAEHPHCHKGPRTAGLLIPDPQEQRRCILAELPEQ